MKQQGSSFIDTIGLAMLQSVLTIGALVVTVTSAVLLFQLGEKYKNGLVTAAAGVVLFVGLLLSFFTTREVVGRMRNDKAMLFGDAVTHTFYSYLTFFCFLPIIGPLLTRFVEKKKAKNPFTSDGD